MQIDLPVCQYKVWTKLKVVASAANRSIDEVVCTITEKATTRAFSVILLKAATTAFTFKTLCGQL